MKKRSTNREAQRRKLVLQGETIVLLRLAELGEVQGGGAYTTSTNTTIGSQNGCGDDLQ
jgi:hypothetical protein